MTVRDEAETLNRTAVAIYQKDWLPDTQRIDDLCQLIARLAQLVAACAPDFKEAP